MRKNHRYAVHVAILVILLEVGILVAGLTGFNGGEIRDSIVTVLKINAWLALVFVFVASAAGMLASWDYLRGHSALLSAKRDHLDRLGKGAETTDQDRQNLPIWRHSHQATSPDGRLVAKVEPAFETSLSGPTCGRLEISDGLTMPRCSPAFLWSDDSRYLAIPVWRYFGRIPLPQRLLVIDVKDRIVFRSRPLGAWLQPVSFVAGNLTIEVNPTRSSHTDFVFTIPAALRKFSQIANY